MTMVHTLLNPYKNLKKIFTEFKSTHSIFSYFTQMHKIKLGFSASDISVPQIQVVLCVTLLF
jgi:hypothetical protein